MGSVDAEGRAGGRVRRPLVSIGAVTAIVVAMDQVTKWWAVSALGDPPRTIDLVWTLRLRLLYNRGTAFSLTSDSGPVVSVIAVLVVAFLIWSGRSQRSWPVLAGYGLIVGGTLGNLTDRIFRESDGFLRGGVVDFVDLQWFPVFNVADAALTIGIIILLVLGFFSDSFTESDEPADIEVADGDSVDPDGPRRPTTTALSGPDGRSVASHSSDLEVDRDSSESAS